MLIDSSFTNYQPVCSYNFTVANIYMLFSVSYYYKIPSQTKSFLRHHLDPGNF